LCWKTGRAAVAVPSVHAQQAAHVGSSRMFDSTGATHSAFEKKSRTGSNDKLCPTL
jgi:hypothetical protein